MLRITHDRQDPQRCLLRLEGRLVGPWVSELQELCERAIGDGLAVTLDLGEVRFVDHAAAQLLHRLADRQVRLAGGSPFVLEQLRNGQQMV
jgi:anti-anti-sigma regulatory factor